MIWVTVMKVHQGTRLYLMSRQNEYRHAVDWIFRYGNEKLAEVERIPLTGLIGNTFGSIFSNMDDK